MIDLHTHTNASDGTLTREKLLHYAKLCGVTDIAISDHDTMFNAGPRPGDPVNVVPAVELSTRDKATGRKVHVLCYCPKKPEKLDGFFRFMAEGRNMLSERIIERLNPTYPVITQENVSRYCGAGVMFKQSIMMVFVEYGYCCDVYGSFYKSVMNRDVLGFDPNPQLIDPREAVRLAHEAGGAAVIAHPSVYDSLALVRELALSGEIDGVEIDHPRNTAQDKELLRKLAADCSLIATGGSDYHAFSSNHYPLKPGDGVTAPAELLRIYDKVKEQK